MARLAASVPVTSARAVSNRADASLKPSALVIGCVYVGTPFSMSPNGTPLQKASDICSSANPIAKYSSPISAAGGGVTY